MKIGITTFGGDGGKSGISQYIINLLREFSSLMSGESGEVLVYEEEKNIFVPDKGDILPLCFDYRLRSPILNLAWHQVALPRWCRKRKYDVLFLPAGNRRLPLSVPCPTVGTVHDFSSIHVEGKYDPARMFYISRVLPLLIRRLTRVITVSESSKRDIMEHAGVLEERIAVTPLAADSELYFPRDKENATSRIRSQYGVQPPYIFYLSRIEHPGKNHVGLIRAFARLKTTRAIPHQLVLAGSDWLRADEVHRAAADSGCAGDILFTGFTPAEDLPDLYCGADLFVFPSLYEGFGLPVLEAMSCGVPVACSNLSSMPEVAGEGALLFDPYDEEAMAETIRSVLMDANVQKHYARLGLARSKEFSWSRTAVRTLEVIRAAAEEYH
jgi:glycosyltransferase involved in cell wall biosynthesis